jgi:hypothetical protein
MHENHAIFPHARSCQEAILKYTCAVCSLCLPQPLSALDAAAVDSLPPPAAELALAVQLVCVAARISPSADPLIPLVEPSIAAPDTCALASIGALLALSYAAAARPSPIETLSSQISFDISTLAAALFASKQHSSNVACSVDIVSEFVSEILRRCSVWAHVLETTLHQHAVLAIHKLVSQVMHPHMSSCVDAILPTICDICCHFDVAHRGTGARTLMHVMSQADKVILRQHKDRILKVRSALADLPL